MTTETRTTTTSHATAWKTFAQRARADLARLAQQLRANLDMTFRNVTALFALSAVALYAIGIVQRLAVLNAEHVPPTKGLPLTALQDYLVQGVATVLSPSTLYVMIEIGLLVLIIVVSPSVRALARDLSSDGGTGDEPPASPEHRDDERADDEEPPGEDVSGERLTVAELVALAMGLVFFVAAFFVVVSINVESVGMVVFVPLAKWGPYVAALIPALLVRILIGTQLLELGPWADWTRAHARTVAVTIALMVLTFVLVKVWYVPKPLDRVAIQTVGGARLPSAGYLGSENGMVYVLGKQRGNRRSETPIVAIPIARIASMSIARGPARTYKTLPQLTGFHDGIARQKFHGDVSVGWCAWMPDPFKRICRKSGL